MHRGDRCLHGIWPPAARAQRALGERRPFGDLRRVPPRPVLRREQHELTVRRDARVASRRLGPFSLLAAIAAVHAQAPAADSTDWREIVALYDVLWSIEPSPVVELNRAVAVAMRDGPAAGLLLIDALLDRGELSEYHLAHAARADLCRRLGLAERARASYERAIALARQEPERRFLQKRLAEVSR
jgi:RNA polymerase sigma-70 factor (ECF subfamily)